MQVQDTYWSASRIRSSFNHHKTEFTNDFSTIFNWITMKENKHRSIFANASVVKLFFKQQDDDEQQIV